MGQSGGSWHLDPHRQALGGQELGLKPDLLVSKGVRKKGSWPRAREGIGKGGEGKGERKGREGTRAGVRPGAGNCLG